MGRTHVAADSRLPQVLERLRLAWNRHCRVHPLGPPPSPAQLPPQARLPGEDGGAPAILPGQGWVGAPPGSLLSCAGTDTDQRQEGRICWVLPPAGSLRPAGRAPGDSALGPPQEDAVGQRRALQEQLQRGLQERTWRLRAIGAR